MVRVQGDEAIAAIGGVRLAGTLADLIWYLVSTRIFVFLNRLLTIWDYKTFLNIPLNMFSSWNIKYATSSIWPVEDWQLKPLYEVLSWVHLLVQVALPLVLFNLKDSSLDGQLFSMILLGVCGLPAAFLVAAVALGIPFALLFSASLLPCGLTVPLAGPYLHLTAEPSPPGSWTVTHFKTTGNETSLFHSEAHQNPSVIKFLEEWIKNRAKVQEAHK